MRKLLSLFAPKKPENSDVFTPNVNVISYGQQLAPVDSAQIQNVLEFLFLSLLNVEYVGKAHLFWSDTERDEEQIRQQCKFAKKNQLIFLFRYGDRTPAPPDGYYWRMMPEHSSMRIYQLVAKADD